MATETEKKSLGLLLKEIAEATGVKMNVGEDNDGQVVLYTGLKCDQQGDLSRMEES